MGTLLKYVKNYQIIMEWKRKRLMKIINSGSTYQIFGDDIRTSDALPVGTYNINFNPMSGYSLEKVTDYKPTGEKIYGDHEAKVKKVMNTYQLIDRSLGIILSGDKGMGKTLFANLLGLQAQKLGMPIIRVNKNTPHLVDFLSSIEQEVLYLFDEFEKTFPREGDNDEGSSQNQFLGFFDGTSQQKALFVLTVNNIYQLSQYFVSRPGRFHYNLTFEYPTVDETREYLQDNLDDYNEEEVKHIIQFSRGVPTNYDSLRAIAFEMNQGYLFKDAIKDLNILSVNSRSVKYRVSLVDDKGKTYANLGQIETDVMNPYDTYDYFRGQGIDIRLSGSYSDGKFDAKGDYVIPGTNFKVRNDWDPDDYDENEKKPNDLEGHLAYVILSPQTVTQSNGYNIAY